MDIIIGDPGAPLFPSLMIPCKDEIEAFGEHWCGPGAYKIWEKTLIAVYEPAEEGADYKAARVYCTAAPARFYEIQFTDGENRISISTGSDEHELAALIAESLSEGALGVDVNKPIEPEE